jgi:hypothetical protein
MFSTFFTIYSWALPSATGDAPQARDRPFSRDMDRLERCCQLDLSLNHAIDKLKRLLPHLESLPPDEVLDSARNIEMYDRVARRNFGRDSLPAPGGTINLHILTNQAAVPV